MEEDDVNSISDDSDRDHGRDETRTRLPLLLFSL